MTLPKQDYERLIAYAAGDGLPEEAADLARLLADDPEAAATVNRFRETLAAMRADRSEAPPAETLATAKSLFRKPAAGPSLFERLTRVLADLVYDSRSQAALVGVRGAGQVYQLSYEFPLGEIDVQVEPAGGPEPAERRLMGQLTMQGDPQTARVLITPAGADDTVATAAVDARGVFSITTGPGSFDLWIALGDRVLVVPGVEVR